MASCKDCIHYCRCKDTVADENWVDVVPDIFTPEGCVDFKPTADVVEVKHGKWTPMMSVCNRGVCSVCNEVGAIRWNYCPNCGAKMDGKDINVPAIDGRSETNAETK